MTHTPEAPPTTPKIPKPEGPFYLARYSRHAQRLSQIGPQRPGAFEVAWVRERERELALQGVPPRCLTADRATGGDYPSAETIWELRPKSFREEIARSHLHPLPIFCVFLSTEDQRKRLEGEPWEATDLWKSHFGPADPYAEAPFGDDEAEFFKRLRRFKRQAARDRGDEDWDAPPDDGAVAGDEADTGEGREEGEDGQDGDEGAQIVPAFRNGLSEGVFPEALGSLHSQFSPDWFPAGPAGSKTQSCSSKTRPPQARSSRAPRSDAAGLPAANPPSSSTSGSSAPANGVHADRVPDVSGPSPSDRTARTSSQESAQGLEWAFELSRRVAAGDLAAEPELQRWVREHPDIVGSFGDLATIVAARLLDQAGLLPVDRAAFESGQQQLREELLGEGVGPLERIAIERLLTCRVHCTALEYAISTAPNGICSPRLQEALRKAERRLVLAVRGVQQAHAADSRSGRPARRPLRDAHRTPIGAGSDTTGG